MRTVGHHLVECGCKVPYPLVLVGGVVLHVPGGGRGGGGGGEGLQGAGGVLPGLALDRAEPTPPPLTPVEALAVGLQMEVHEDFTITEKTPSDGRL